MNNWQSTKPQIHTALCSIWQELLDKETKYTQARSDNLTKNERIALKQLMDNPLLVINKADKGNTVINTVVTRYKNFSKMLCW